MPRLVIGEAHDCALEVLEQLEYKSLSWGYVDGSLSESEAELAITDEFGRFNINDNPGDILDELVAAKLVRTWREPDRRYRTRFAELVRLLIRSRQLLHRKKWQTGPSLVSDFRVDLRKRSIPRSEVDPISAFDEIAARNTLTKLQKYLWNSLSGANSGFKLRKFQSDAAKRILGTSGEHGTIITAGTGSGKTLAFYLPVLTAIGEGIRVEECWTRALCIYPRKELLKDQFSEAYRLCQSAKHTLTAGDRRPASLGALFHEIPNFPNETSLSYKSWKKISAGYICPILRCFKCSAELVWRNDDLTRRVERLSCINSNCDATTDQTEVRLSRQSLQNKPPDLLFTTTEMLNQRLSDTSYRKLFGIGQPEDKKLQFVLLDEVHTYSGTSGAQTALLLRRFRHLLSHKVRWVGLSATLREAPIFFAELCGLWPDKVIEVTPASQDLDYVSAEYQILLRSNPAFQTSTLSTSIQASMLISRMLDTDATESSGRFGKRLFAFTDDLDVTHRLFDNLRDAEAYDRFGKPDSSRIPLAYLRSENLPDSEEREVDGQRWILAEDIQGRLENRLVIGRTTSRDPGVDDRANVIVATSALEVGFNDPKVGAVLQHKSPHSFASFLQRRGRAGREVNMRPLTVTVLSDYGRDRLAFQSYEHFFNPALERQSLPVRNSYVLRMQAVFSTLDWITNKLVSDDGNSKGWAWQVLSERKKYETQNQKFLLKTKQLIRSIIRLEQNEIADLSRHLRASLDISLEEVNSILWDPPRSLLLEAIPTLTRRLFRDWKLAYGKGLDLMVPHHPLPDFIPRNLFRDLNLPEVIVHVPAATKNAQEKQEQMPIFQAITQFAPGRVSRRFADEYGRLSHWSPLPDQTSEVEISIEDFASKSEFVSTVTGNFNDSKMSLEVYRPWSMKIQKVPSNVHSYSYAAWLWQSSIEFIGNPYIVNVPERSFWSNTLPHLEFFLHRFSTATTQTRFAIEGEAKIGRRSGVQYCKFNLVGGDGVPVAVGFTYETDALLVPLHLPMPNNISSRELPSDLSNWLRTLHFRRAVLTDNDLPKTLNHFQRDWLYQIFLLSVVCEAEKYSVGFEEIVHSVSSNVDVARFEEYIAAIVDARVLDVDETLETTLSKSLLEVLRDSNVAHRLCELAIQSSQLGEENWGTWILELLKNTVAEAVLQACFVATPANTTLEGLTVDIVERNNYFAAYVAETTLGGGGTIESMANQFSSDPRSFLRAYEAALSPSDLETSADSLELVCRLAVYDDEVRTCLSRLRNADDVEMRTQEKEILFQLLSRRGISVSHALSVSIATRLLRPGANSISDKLTIELIDQWEATENRFKFSLPLRIATAVLASKNNFKTRLESMGKGKFSAIDVSNLLLWPRKGELRLTDMQSYNPYRDKYLTDTLLAREILIRPQTESILLFSEGWCSQLNRALVRNGEAVLSAKLDQVSLLRAEIVKLINQPIETEYLRLFPCLAGVKRESDLWLAMIYVRELG